MYGKNLVTAMVHLWILGTKDTGLSNILAQIQQRKVYVIDFEENRSSDIDDNMFYFYGCCAKKYKWVDNVVTYYNAVANKLKSLLDGSNGVNVSKVKTAIERLLKYGGSINQTQSNVGSFISFTNINVNAGRSNIVGSSNLSSSETINSTPLGKMEWKGMFGGSTTYSGYRLDEMKSAMQKYIRKGNLKKEL